MKQRLFSAPGWLGLALALGPGVARAQPSGEAPDMGPGAAVAAAAAADVLRRSGVWQAVNAVHHRREGFSGPDHRLTAEQREQLRDQVRRASVRTEMAPTRLATPPGGR